MGVCKPDKVDPANESRGRRAGGVIREEEQTMGQRAKRGMMGEYGAHVPSADSSRSLWQGTERRTKEVFAVIFELDK